MSQTSLELFVEQQKMPPNNPHGFWLGEASVESIQAHDREHPLSDPEKNIIAIEALNSANEELYSYLVADIGIQNHALMPEFQNSEFHQQYSSSCFQHPEQIEIFLRAGGKLLSGMVEYREIEDSTIILLQHNESSMSPAEHAHSLNTFSRMNKSLLLDVFNKECFDSQGNAILSKTKKFNQYVLPHLFTLFADSGLEAPPLSAERLRETQLMHPLPHGWLISFMEQNHSYEIAHYLNSKHFLEDAGEPAVYARDIFKIFLDDIHDSVNNPESLALKEKMAPFEIDDFFGEDWKSTWETDLVLGTVIQSTLFPEADPLPEVERFLDTALWMARYFNTQSGQLSSHICGFIFNHLMLNPEILEEADFSNNSITQAQSAAEAFEVLSKSSDIFIKITSALIQPTISLQHLSNHSLNNPHILSKYMEWMGANVYYFSLSGIPEWERVERINDHVLNFSLATNKDTYWLDQTQHLKQEFQSEKNEDMSLGKYKILKWAEYKSAITQEVLRMKTPLLMDALNLANQFSEDLSITMLKKHVSSTTVKPVIEQKITPTAPTRF